MQYDEATIKQLSEVIAREVVERLAQDEPAAEEEATPAERATPVPDDPAGEPIARLIDHTLLKPDATQADIHRICGEARTHQFASVCVNPVHVSLVARLLRDTNVATCTVVGFPLGANSRSAKVFETEQALRDGATEIDMVINVGALKSGDYQTVLEDIEGVVRAAHAASGLVKVIIEAALLADDEKVVACRLAQAAGADYVKTSTGFGPGGATVEDVALMRRTVGPEMGVKAAGGIRSYADAQAMIEAGATRLGASAGVKIAGEAEEE